MNFRLLRWDGKIKCLLSFLGFSDHFAHNSPNQMCVFCAVFRLTIFQYRFPFRMLLIVTVVAGAAVWLYFYNYGSAISIC
jgi:hypothetical protein